MTPKNKNFVIAIDGPTASGKGTLARRLAVHFDCAYLDTGALYRLVALHVFEAGQSPDDEEAAAEIAEKLSGHITPEMLANPALRDHRMSQASSKVAAYGGVRAALLQAQRNFALQPPQKPDGTAYQGAVLDGRDIGTHICPNAQIKLFVTANPEIRAKRRYLELRTKSSSVTEQAVLIDIKARDDRDSNRALVPLRQADDAILIDTSDMNADQAFDAAVQIVQKQLERIS